MSIIKKITKRNLSIKAVYIIKTNFIKAIKGIEIMILVVNWKNLYKKII